MFIIDTIKSIFSLGGTIFKVLKIVLCLLFIWVVLNFLNSKFSIFAPFKAILKAVYTGIKGAFSLIGLG